MKVSPDLKSTEVLAVSVELLQKRRNEDGWVVVYMSVATNAVNTDLLLM